MTPGASYGMVCAMHVRDGTTDDLPAVIAIFNHAIATSNAIFDVAPYEAAERARWFEQFGSEHPFVVCTEADRLLGFAYYLPYRSKAAYRMTKETTVYVAHDAQRRGVGSMLYASLIERARSGDVHVLVAVLTSGNDASAALHRRHGFTHVGHMREVGHKHGQWLDTDYWQRVL